MHPVLSVIVPFYDEEASIEALYSAVVNAVAPLGMTFEMVFVDDGSRDRTAVIAEQLVRRDPRVRLVQLRRNYGQAPAMAAGIEHARGQVLVTMDGDLQNDPADIALLLEKIREGFDVVVGWRFARKDKLISRRIPSRMANWLIGRVTGVAINDNGCTLKAYRAELIKRIPLYSEMHRFIPAMATLAGARIAEVKVRHHARRFGRSKYGLSRVYKVLLDLLVIKTVTVFAARPLRWFGMLAVILAVPGVFAIGDALWRWGATGGALSLPVAGTGVLLLMSALVLACAGMLAELLYKLGDTRDLDFSRLTSVVWGAAAARMRPEFRAHD